MNGGSSPALLFGPEEALRTTKVYVYYMEEFQGFFVFMSLIRCEMVQICQVFFQPSFSSHALNAFGEMITTVGLNAEIKIRRTIPSQ